jgi:hypothetical protein
MLQWRSGFDPSPFHVEFMVDKAAKRQVFVRVIQFFPISISPQVLNTLIHLPTTLWSRQLTTSLNILLVFHEIGPGLTKKILRTEEGTYKEDPTDRGRNIQRRSYWQRKEHTKKILLTEEGTYKEDPTDRGRNIQRRSYRQRKEHTKQMEKVDTTDCFHFQ